ncbi:hypothetical protein SDC9_175866 [bioreactor metagenome]|uniref:DUF3244 domain-containing protein n=1 Tax=bioreactor metagenome TaxID=1076179 RepID=A0A645GNY6_9ZZZZ
MEAHHDDSILELFVDNYTGSVTMHILSSSLCITVGINETGYVTMDISQLPEGSYTLQVVIGSAIFEGDFEL